MGNKVKKSSECYENCLGRFEAKCRRPSTAGYDFTATSEAVPMSNFGVKGIKCDRGYTGIPEASVCELDGTHYEVSGCRRPAPHSTPPEFRIKDRYEVKHEGRWLPAVVMGSHHEGGKYRATVFLDDEGTIGVFPSRSEIREVPDDERCFHHRDIVGSEKWRGRDRCPSRGHMYMVGRRCRCDE